MRKFKKKDRLTGLSIESGVPDLADGTIIYLEFGGGNSTSAIPDTYENRSKLRDWLYEAAFLIDSSIYREDEYELEKP